MSRHCVAPGLEWTDGASGLAWCEDRDTSDLRFWKTGASGEVGPSIVGPRGSSLLVDWTGSEFGLVWIGAEGPPTVFFQRLSLCE